MNIIFLTKRANRSGCFNLGHRGAWFLVVLVALLIPVAMLSAGYWLGQQQGQQALLSQGLQQEVLQQRQKVSRAAQKARADLNGLAVRLGQLQAQAVRLNALGQRLVKAGHLEKGEFDFSHPPAQGGPQADRVTLQQIEPPDFLQELDRLAAELNDRESQLRVMEAIFMHRKLQQEVLPAGKPIRKGWISSYYGMRTDPFTGLREFHKGMDFAGKMGSDVIAAAGGVITWAGPRYGYGLMIEINHGNGYITRYGHNRESLVKVGDVVAKGQTIAHMGSSGRSTGPHVHFEVHYKGRVVDPAKYVVAGR